MKKFLILCLLIISVACSTKTYDIEFKNPIFYQPLRPLSNSNGYVYLTPTFVDFKTPLDKNKTDVSGSCDLIENEQDHITQKCVVTIWGQKYTRYYTYVIKDMFLPTCFRILQYMYKNPQSFPKYEMEANKYCVTPPDQQLESN